MQIQKIVIVGGGTAGWLAANHLGKALKDNRDIEITVIESPDIPPIGVGEGTVPTIRQSLKEFGISETDFICSCDVTFKQSIKFVNWLDKTKHGFDNAFHHLFDTPSPFGKDLSDHWLNQQGSSVYAEFVSPQFVSCEHFKAPKTITTPEYQGAHGYAYHLNAAKFAVLLAKNATEKFNVNHVQTNVVEVILNDSGEIASLTTDSEGSLAFDFYIDCTGFEALLMEKALKVEFVSKAKELLVDSALVVQVPTQESDEIPPYTIATAHQAGWIWDIALTDRRGVGFVYSSKHMNDEEAKKKLDHYLGGKLADLPHRKLPMRVGHIKKFWHKNCIALGLAQGFLEPLEASSILLTDFAASFISRRFPDNKSDMQTLENRFNQVMTYAWQRVVDFVKLHYYISDRCDSQFWLDNRKADTISDSLKERLSLWQSFTPHPDDFFAQFEVFGVDNYLYLLYGMNYTTHKPLMTDEQLQMAQQQVDKISEYGKYLINELPSHRELINKIKRYGLQTM